VGNSEIKNIKRQLKKQGYSDVVIEEILKWYLGKKRNNKAFKNAESTTKVGLIMSESVKCPICGKQSSGKPKKTWKFRFYKVGRYECPSCKSMFNIYESPNSTFTIPKSKRK